MAGLYQAAYMFKRNQHKYIHMSVNRIEQATNEFLNFDILPIVKLTLDPYRKLR